jgi:hypothetical protein
MHELEKLYSILTVFLGESKSGYSDGQMQYQFPCPHCIEKYGHQEARKYNLEVSFTKGGVYQCWKCSSEGDDLMHGSIKKLIRLFGNEKLLDEYVNVIHSIRNSELYKLHFSDFDKTIIEKEELKFPSTFKMFKKDEKNHYGALKYLQDRGLGWDIIEKFKIGYTLREEDDKMKKYSYRVIIPSYNSIGELNYWVGRDYLPKNPKFERTKYSNPKAEKKEIIFNEDRIQWDADITLVEGAFDHIVVPNSIPLLGKALDKDYKLYWDIVSRCNGNVNIMLDADAYQSVKEIYKLLNHGRLYNKIRYIPIEEGEDPSSLYQEGGYKKIAEHLANAQQIKEVYLY